MRQAFVIGAGAALVMIAGAASAQSYTLIDGNTIQHYDTASLAPNSRVGMDRWEVDGVNHMYSQWFWFRTDGMAHEARINSLAFLAGGTSDTNFNGLDDTLYLQYGSHQDFTIETTFSLRGGSAGSHRSDTGEQITITNHGPSRRTFSFFQYCDFDLANDIVDDSVGLLNPNAVLQVDNLHGFIASETILTPTFTLSEMGVYAATLLKLDNGVADNLDGSTGPLVGRRDYTWAFQWDVTLASGESFLISKDKSIIPAPSAAALLGLGGLLGIRRRR